MSSNIHVTLYREKGIHKSLSMAKKGDIVLLTGLGFGGYQVENGQRLLYSENEVIDQYLQKLVSDLPES